MNELFFKPFSKLDMRKGAFTHDSIQHIEDNEQSNHKIIFI